MSAWTDDRLDQIGSTTELEIAPRRADGSLRPYTTIWVVRVDRDLFVRSWNGVDGSWFGAAQRNGDGRIRVAGVEHDVTFERADDIDRDTIDTAYQDKYGRSMYVDGMTADGAAATTTRLLPR